MPPLMVAVHFGRALVRRAEMELRLETSSTATRHHLPNGLDVTDLHKTKPVCACAAQRPSNASPLGGRGMPRLSHAPLCPTGSAVPAADPD